MKTLLILDEHSVADHRGVEFRLNPARKHPENPVLLPGPAHAWDGLQVSWPTRILLDPGTRIFRCLYHGMPALQYDTQQHLERTPFARWLGIRDGEGGTLVMPFSPKTCWTNPEQSNPEGEVPP